MQHEHLLAAEGSGCIDRLTPTSLACVNIAPIKGPVRCRPATAVQTSEEERVVYVLSDNPIPLATATTHHDNRLLLHHSAVGHNKATDSLKDMLLYLNNPSRILLDFLRRFPRN